MSNLCEVSMFDHVLETKRTKYPRIRIHIQIADPDGQCKTFSLLFQNQKIIAYPDPYPCKKAKKIKLLVKKIFLFLFYFY